MPKHKNKIIYEFGTPGKLHYQARYYENGWYGSQHFTSFNDADKCPENKLLFKLLKDEPRCVVCHAK